MSTCDMPRVKYGSASNVSAESTEKQKYSHSKWSFGVLNDPTTIEVPGSVLLLASDRNQPLGLGSIHANSSHSSIPTDFTVDPVMELQSTSASAPPRTRAKKKTKDGTIILEPQPEESANDPLNWPTWRRDSALLSLGFYCMIGGGIGSIMAAGFTDIAHEYDVNIETVSLIVGLYMMGLGVGSVLASPTAILFGKRPIYLASALVFIGTCLWAGFSPSFPSLLMARVFQGMSLSPVECLPSATIAEIFFLHERAYRIGIYTLLLLGGKNLIPLVSAAIIGRFGWRWVFFTTSLVTVLSLLLLFLFVPETFWDRTPTRSPSKRPGFLRQLSTRRSTSHSQHQVASPKSQQNTQSNGEATASDAPQDAEADDTSSLPAKPPHQAYIHHLRHRPAKSFTQQLRPYHGRLNSDKWHKVLVRPFILFMYPAVLWSAAVYACSIGWLMVISEVMAIIYRDTHTYNFTPLQTGLVYISPLVGGILGTAVAGKLSDVVVRVMASRNGGLYEPEFRLIMALPITLSTVTGLIGFGWSAQAANHWIVPTLFLGTLSFGCSLGSTTSITFCLDSYRQYASEALVTLNFAKNIFHGLTFSLFVSHWMRKDGPRKVFICLGIIQLLLQLTTIPLFIFGKRARLWTVRKDFMHKF